MSTTTHEAGLVSPSGVRVPPDTEIDHQKLAEADTATLENLIEDAVLQMKQGGILNTSFYDSDNLGRIVDAAASLRLRKIGAAPDADLSDDPQVFRTLATSSFITYGRATEEEANEIVATYERAKQQAQSAEEADEVVAAEETDEMTAAQETAPSQPQMTATEKMAFIGSTVLADEDVPPTQLEPLPTAAEIMQAAWRPPTFLDSMLHGMIEMPGLDTAARSYVEDERAWEEANGIGPWGKGLDRIVRDGKSIRAAQEGQARDNS